MNINLMVKEIAKQQFQLKKHNVIKNTITKNKDKMDNDTFQFCLNNALHNING